MKIKLERIVERDNAAELLNERDRADLAAEIIHNYDMDEDHRRGWLQEQQKAIDLAKQVREIKTRPWRNASNIKFPLITIAALQFHARVYPMLIDNDRVVKVKVFGKDPQGLKKQRADRISMHMSYQLLEEDEAWEEDTDRLLITLPITGTEFKKTFYEDGKVRSLWVPSKDLCIPYYARSLEEAPRKTQIHRFTPRSVKEKMLSEFYLDVELGDPALIQEDIDDSRHGANKAGSFDDDSRLRKVIEQHCFYDLDGDGYTEPYVATLDYSDGKLLRLTRRFDEDGIDTNKDNEIAELEQEAMQAMQSVEEPTFRAEIARDYEQAIAQVKKAAKPIKIRPLEYFTKYSFVPSMDGSIYDQGFGTLLGDNNHAVNTLINQLIDAGTLSNMQGGFLGRGARLKGGKLTFTPGEWKQVQAMGDDLRKSIVPMPVREPSPTLFNLLNLLINYGERVASVSDMMVGQTPGQNTPATTSAAALEQGMKVFSGIAKRVFRCAKAEYQKVYRINRDYLDLGRYVQIMDEDAEMLQQDYSGDPTDVRPQGDPKMLSDMAKLNSAAFVAQRAAQVPGYKTDAVEKLLLEANNVTDTESVYPTEEETRIQPPPNPEIEIEKAELERKTAESKWRMDAEFEKLGNDDDRVEIEKALAVAEIMLKSAQAEKLGADGASGKIKALADMLKATRESSNERSKQRGSESSG